MRRLVTYINSLFLGMILGLVFVVIVHGSTSHPEKKDHASGITISYRIPGAFRR